LSFRKNIYSQHGEDGILIELFRRMQVQPKWVCEFGAWDGKCLSNTFYWVTQGARAVYIESDAQRVSDLHATAREYPQIQAFEGRVEPTGSQSLDAWLSKTSIPSNFDLLSIDVDSCDYSIWKHLEMYRPKVVVIEINSSISPDIPDFVHNDQRGTSFLPMLRLGESKRYTLVAHTGNMIFVRNSFLEQVALPLVDPRSLYQRNWAFSS
jgi:hypothetical protein